jgi:acyl dehydratase
VIAWDDLTEGYALEPREYGPLTLTDFVRYQGASGDFNPIHHDPAFAQAAGFPEPFSVGMLQAGILGAYATDTFGPEQVRRFAVSFREQVWVGDVLVCRGEVVGRREEDGERRVDLRLEVSRVGGGVAIRGEATFVVP